MRVLVVGGGAREHALVWKLAQNRRVEKVWCAPGNAGTAGLAENVPIGVDDLDGLVAAATRIRADLVVVGPEAPLAAGLADRLEAAGLRVFGPSRGAARIESSKAWAKEVMTAAGVPTARAAVVRGLAEGRAALPRFGLPVVVKADGLAAGKGVVVAEDEATALGALTSFLSEGTIGGTGCPVLLEEYLVGREASVLAISDGTTVVPLPPARDHKRAFDGDRGPNTGGMGAYAPVPDLDAGALDAIGATVLEPTVRALRDRDVPLRGVLYAGLMLTPEGPKTLEFNARFGDPEAQALLPLLDADLVDLMLAATDGTLAGGTTLSPPEGAAVAVVLASGGYPGAYEAGVPINGLDRVPNDVLVFHGGTRREEDGRVVTAGGRVLTVVGRGSDVAAARARAYAGAEAITFSGRHMRRDIAASGTGAAARG